jgi:hypothetical protein
MPELDYAFMCDYVRSEGGLVHVLGGGIDTLYLPQVPVVANLGLVVRITFTRTECGRPHRIEAILADTDGERLAHLQSTPTLAWTDDLPTGWRRGAFLALNFGVPVPSYGVYSLDILINDNHEKSIDLRAVPVPESTPPAITPPTT